MPKAMATLAWIERDMPCCICWRTLVVFLLGRKGNGAGGWIMRVEVKVKAGGCGELVCVYKGIR